MDDDQIIPAEGDEEIMDESTTRPEVGDQRLGKPLSFVVARARTDGIDVAVVILRLGMHVGIAVDLRRRGLEEARFVAFRRVQAVVGALAADQRRADGIGLVLWR